MPPRTAAASSPFSRIAYGAVIVMLSVYYLGAFLQFHSINSLYLARFMEMVSGTAHRPYVERVLVPGGIRVVSALTPAPVREGFNHVAIRSEFIREWCDAQGWERDHLYEYSIAVVILYACIWGFLIALASLARAVYQAPAAFASVVCAASLVILPAFMKYTNYIYDPATLFLFTLGLALMARRRWRAYFIVYTLACLNKETTILLALVFGLVYVREGLMEARLAWRMLGAQVAIFVAIKGALAFVFRHNPGSVVERHLTHNVALMKDPSFPLWVAFFGGVALLLFYRWKSKPLFLRRGLLILVPLVVLTFFLGQLDEIRDYYEAFPIMALLAGHTCAVMAGVEVTEQKAY